jgi:hypothetical protein
MKEHSIQHKATVVAPSGFGYDDDGNRVPVEMPADPTCAEEFHEDDARRLREETILRFISRLISAGTAENIGRKVLILSFKLHLPDGPGTLEQLGKLFSTGGRLGVGKARVSQIFSKLNPGEDWREGDST